MGPFFWQHISVMHGILVKYCKWTHSAEQKHFSVAMTCCVRAVSHNWGNRINLQCMPFITQPVFLYAREDDKRCHNMLHTKSDFAYSRVVRRDEKLRTNPESNLTSLATTCHMSLLLSVRNILLIYFFKFWQFYNF